MSQTMKGTWMHMLIVVVCLGLGVAQAKGADPELRLAIENGLQRIETGSASYTQHRECFSCHHQAMPIRALTEARRRGFPVAPAKIQHQVEFTLKSFKSKHEDLVKGQGVGGASTTVGYALIALKAADHPPDDTTTVMVKFLLARQKADGSWASSANRPPTEASSFTTTSVALPSLKAYGSLMPGDDEESIELRDRVASAIDRGHEWLLQNKPESTEDQVFRIFGLLAKDRADDEIQNAREALLQQQRDDGGWAQLPKMESDAYATGTVLVVLRMTGLPSDHPAYQKGVRYLVNTQREDGGWFVETRSRPIQTFFDNGDPGGKSQFISFVATSWAVLALLEANGPRRE